MRQSMLPLHDRVARVWVLAALAAFALPFALQARDTEDALAVTQALTATEASSVREAVRACLAWDRPLEALGAAAEAVARRPASSTAWAELAAALYRNSDFDGAESAARRALDLNGNDADARVALARCLDTKGEDEECLKHFEEAVRLDPLHPAALRLLAAKLDSTEDRTRVLELLKRFVDLKAPGPSGRMFTEHAQKSREMLKALGDTATEVEPEWEKRPESVSVRMEVTEDQPSVTVEFGKIKSDCLFDTGEESLTLSEETVAAIGAKKVGQLPASTATGLEMMDVVLVPELKVGAFSIKNVIAGVGTGDIVGPSIFKSYRVKMDFQRKQLVLKRQPENTAPGGKDLEAAAGDAEGVRRMRFRRQGGLVWFPVAADGESAPLQRRGAWGFLDTGCQPTGLVFPRYLEALSSDPEKAPKTLPFRSALGGAARDGKEELMRLVPELKLRFLGCEMRAEKLISSDSLGSINQSTEAEADAIVGWPMILKTFKSLEIDFERCVLTCEPREAKVRK
ncbi:MAG: aspartyl protease family protein [Planctomycetes bacterium]|nr:aspartyl protease family protein [Planctomycetota bacterium]